jgi:hypothetical protein
LILLRYLKNYYFLLKFFQRNLFLIQTNDESSLVIGVNRLVEEDEEDLEDVDEENELDDDEDESESEVGEERVPTPKTKEGEDDLDTDQETDRLLGQQYNDDNGYYDSKVRTVTQHIFKGNLIIIFRRRCLV